MFPYQVYLHSEALDSLPKSGKQRRLITDFQLHLQNHPDTKGDYTEKDQSLRVYQVKFIGSYAVSYWLDAPVRIVMITGVRRADRSR